MQGQNEIVEFLKLAKTKNQDNIAECLNTIIQILKPVLAPKSDQSTESDDLGFWIDLESGRGARTSHALLTLKH